MSSDEISQAVAALAEAGRARQPGEPVLAILDCALMRITLRYEGLRAWSGQEPREGLPGAAVSPERPVGVPSCGLWLSPAEKAVVRVCKTDEWIAAPQIALMAGLEANNAFSCLLKNLVDREILRSAPSRGYCLAGPG